MWSIQDSSTGDEETVGSSNSSARLGQENIGKASKVCRSSSESEKMKQKYSLHIEINEKRNNISVVLRELWKKN